MEFYGRETSPLPMNFHVEGINDVVNLVSLRLLGFGQHFCFIWCGDDMLVRWDLTGEKISDALSEMEHLSSEVLHQSECHVLLELSLATSLISENLYFLRTVSALELHMLLRRRRLRSRVSLETQQQSPVLRFVHPIQP